MAIAELGYRPWKGRLRPAATRWLVIARFGIAAQFKSKALRRFLLAAWLPLLYFGGAFFAVGWFTENMDRMDSPAFGIIRGFAGPIAFMFMEDPSAAREGIWSILFYYFFTITQTFITMIVVAIAGPPLLSQDVRGNFLLYFSRPITRWEYLLGKCSILFFFIFMTTLFPATALYAISIAFSPELAVVGETFWVFGRSILASLVIAIPCTLVVLYLSSIVQESRWALIGWLAVWLIGELVSGILSGFGEFQKLEDLGVLLSLRENILTVCQHIFDVPATLEAVKGFDPGMDEFLKSFMPDRSLWKSLAVLGVVSLACFIGIVRRISAPLRV